MFTERILNLELVHETLEKITQFFFDFSRKPIYVAEVTYTTIGVKLLVLALYGARFVVLIPPLCE